MENITFKNINVIGNVAIENDLYAILHYPEMLNRYDSNFMQFKKSPSFAEFREAEIALKEFHVKNGQNHLKFCFVENEKLATEVEEYLKENKYDIGFLELYAIKPECFPITASTGSIEIKVVTEDTLEDYLSLNFEHDLEYGESFAKKKIDLNKNHFRDAGIVQLLAFKQGSAVGYVDVILADKTVEIDGLQVKKEFQREGIGTELQKFVMETFPEHTVILVADGEDTPREMYQKQNYQMLGFRYEALKVE
ncbi:N-acetyltransferase [Oceanobacillus piezotolerans]|uniref:N-acetyltransferase n=1 Tax=Oceanobacillus piezotolerans TaxID=2448030 RepID=A0A498DDZ6_9BACI|nr:GNAT family N-acetyltransferase [Oceanobacillus piezotolerans]RLL41305.1 N-acetyltransferase [Oceanobacillus piezotolerans]